MKILCSEVKIKRIFLWSNAKLCNTITEFNLSSIVDYICIVDDLYYLYLQKWNYWARNKAKVIFLTKSCKKYSKINMVKYYGTLIWTL